jgi:hypothetical protein
MKPKASYLKKVISYLSAFTREIEESLGICPVIYCWSS